MNFETPFGSPATVYVTVFGAGTRFATDALTTFIGGNRMLKHVFSFMAVGLAAFLSMNTFSSHAIAADTDKATGGSLSSHDLKFVTDAAQSGMTEVKASQVALTKTTNPQLKDFAQKMIDDHTKANDQLKTLAEGKGVTFPTNLDSSDQSRIDDLGNTNGPDFDKAYVKMMVKDHKDAVELFQHYSGAVKSMFHSPADDADLRDFASKTLPTLQEHLAMIQGMQDNMK
jgi:putative membrane protein